MKIAILIFILAGITFLGCSDNFENTLVSSPVNTDQVYKSQLFEPQLDILYPAILQSIFLSQKVDGSIYTELIIDTTYIDSEGRDIELYVRLKFPAGSFEDAVGQRTTSSNLGW